MGFLSGYPRAFAPWFVLTLLGSVSCAGSCGAQTTSHPLRSPGDPALASWTIEAVTAPLNFDYVNASAQMSKASGLFTDDGWATFIANPGRSAQMEWVKATRMLCHASPRGEPLVLNHDVTPGSGEHESQEVSFAVVQTCENSNEFSTTSYLAKARVVWSTDGTVPGVPLVANLTLIPLP